MQKSFFITFEGPEGSGKSTIIKMIAAYLEEKKWAYVVTREPGGSAIAEQIRNIILDPNNLTISYETEALLYAASRAQHFKDVIAPALKEKKIVLCDRFIDSSLAYQGVARGLGLERISQLNRFAINDVWPDLTIFFDIDPLAGLARIKENNDREINRLDLEKQQFHDQVYEGYKEVIRLNPQRFKVVDAAQEIEKVFNDVKNIITSSIEG